MSHYVYEFNFPIQYDLAFEITRNTATGMGGSVETDLSTGLIKIELGIQWDVDAVSYAIGVRTAGTRTFLEIDVTPLTRKSLFNKDAESVLGKKALRYYDIFISRLNDQLEQPKASEPFSSLIGTLTFQFTTEPDLAYDFIHQVLSSFAEVKALNSTSGSIQANSIGAFYQIDIKSSGTSLAYDVSIDPFIDPALPVNKRKVALEYYKLLKQRIGEGLKSFDQLWDLIPPDEYTAAIHRPLAKEDIYEAVLQTAYVFGSVLHTDSDASEVHVVRETKPDLPGFELQIKVIPSEPEITLDIKTLPGKDNDLFQTTKYSKKHYQEFLELLNQEFKKPQYLWPEFHATQKAGLLLAINEKDNTFFLPSLPKENSSAGHNRIFQFEDLIGYELIEDEEIKSKKNNLLTITGGLAYGLRGSVAGSMIGRHNKTVCNQMQIALRFNNLSDPIQFIVLNNQPVNKNGVRYNELRHITLQCTALLEIILNSNKSKTQPQLVQPPFPASDADELLKFHELMERGILTAEEFEMKKKQILGL